MLGATMIPGSADPKSSQAQPSWVVGPSIPAASRLGQVIEGEFLIKGVLGQGELGVTYEAENARLKRKFAVLMLKRELKPTHEMMLAVRNDLRRAQQLGAAGLMPVKMLADRDGIPGFATELLDGETLRARLNRGPLRAERALAIIVSVARTLDAAHKVGLVHGDLRPENIYLVRTTAKNASAGKVMVVEHGMHHLRRRAAGLDDRLPLYKHLYRPPEQVAGMIGATERGDVFVLGAILHECLTARPAFFAEEIEFILENLASPPPPLTPSPATGLSRELAEALTLLIRQACALQLEDRVPSMAELIEGIEQIVGGYGLKLPEPPVEAKDEVTLPAKAPTAESQSMSRLLQRMSGVFPQIALPPTGSPVGPPTEAPAGAPGDTGPSAVRINAETAASIPRLEPLQQERVSRILKRLSGAFPTISTTPSDSEAGGSGAAQSDAPSGAAVVAQVAPAAAPSAPSSAATPVPGASPAALALPPPPVPAPVLVTPESAITDPRVAIPVLPPVAPAPSAQIVASPASPVAATETPASRPATTAADRVSSGLGPASAGPLVEPLPAPPAPSIGTPSAKSPLSLGLPSASSGPAPRRATDRDEPRPLASPTPAASVRADAVLATPGPTEQAVHEPAAATPSPLASGAGASPGSVATEAPPEQPITAPILPPAQVGPSARPVVADAVAAPALPPTLVGALAPLVAADLPPPPAGPPEVPTRPRLEVSTELAVPPLALGGGPAPLLPAPMVLLPAPLVAPPPPQLPGGGVAASLSPFGSGAIPAVPAPPALPSLISSAPTAVQLPKPAGLQRETTLAGDDLAELLEPSQPAIPVPPPPSPAASIVPAPLHHPEPSRAAEPPAKEPRAAAESDIGALRTVAQIEALPAPGSVAGRALGSDLDAARVEARPLADLATRPVLAALAERLAPLPPRINELPTQPAVRRLPITELATQAKISTDGVEALNPALLEEAPPSLPPTPALGLPLAPPAPVASPAPAVVTAVPQAPPVTSPAAAPAPPASPSAVTAPERPPAPRPPRVSQLIAALQNQQGPTKPPPEPEAAAVPAPTPAPAAAPPVASAVGPKATGGQPRGLMAPSPDALAPLRSGETPALASSAHPARVSPAAVPAIPPPSSPMARFVELALHHQELTAAGLGAVLVLLITLLYLVVVR